MSRPQGEALVIKSHTNLETGEVVFYGVIGGKDVIRSQLKVDRSRNGHIRPNEPLNADLDIKDGTITIIQIGACIKIIIKANRSQPNCCTNIGYPALVTVKVIFSEYADIKPVDTAKMRLYRALESFKQRYLEIQAD